MLLLVWLVLGAPSVLACDGFLGCFKADFLQAFSRIAASDSYTLVPGLTFDRRQDAPRSLVEVPPRSDIGVADIYRGAERLFKSHSLFWNVLPGVDVSVSEGKDGKFVLGVQKCHHESESRTFGKFGMMRRMKLIMLPIMYKLGVITTLLTLLTVFALKGLTIGVLLLVMSSAGLAAKFKYAHYSPQPHWQPSKEVHVHVHGGGGHHSYHSPVHYDDPWVREDRHPPGPNNWIQHQPPPPPPPSRATPSPWASYIGDQAI